MLNPNYKNIIINKLLPFEPKSIGIFGSYARGEETPESDLDVLFEYGKTPDLFEWIRIERELSEEIGIKVDLVSYFAIKNERLKGYIYKDYQKLF